MRRIFIDCGFYVGNEVKKYLESKTINKKWEVYAFEPATHIDLKAQVERHPIKIELIKKAVWIKNEKLKFWISARDNASYVEGTGLFNAPDKEITVQAIDFSKFVAKLPEDARIICSMDIEGCEFPVLEKMLKDGTIDRISILDIEFHHRMLPDKTEEDARKLIEQIKARGVKVKLKVDLI